MKKKISAVIILVICVFSIGYFYYHNKNIEKSKATNVSSKAEFKVKSAFADVDYDMIVQEKDEQDDDPNYDYVFITFTNEVVDSKKNDNTNPFYVKNYKLDGSELPEGSEIFSGSPNQIVIKFKNGTLKGINSPHELAVAKDIKDKKGEAIKGDLNLKLPFSIADTPNNKDSKKDSAKDGKKDNTNKDPKSSSSENKNASENKNSSGNEKGNANADMPKYTVEIAKGVPMSTAVAVRLDTKTPENYKVVVDGKQLELKTNSKGEKIFIESLDKEYELEDIKNLIVIEPVKK